MQAMGCGSPSLCEGVQARPCHPVALTASAQHLTPLAPDGVAAYREQAPLARDGLVSILPQQHALQPGPLLRDGPVPAPAQRLVHGLRFLAEPLDNGLAPDRQLSRPRCTTNRRHTETVAGRRFALSPPLAPFDCDASALDQPCFLRMPCPIDLPHTVPQCAPEPFGGVPGCEAHDELGGVAPDEPIPACVLPSPSVRPQVQDVGQVAMRCQRVHTAPWGRPLCRRVPLPLFQHTRVSPFLPVTPDALVPHPMHDALCRPLSPNSV
jgi:hypothetical protein